VTPACQQACARNGAWHRKHDLLLAPVTPTAAPPVETLYNSDAFPRWTKGAAYTCPSTSPASLPPRCPLAHPPGLQIATSVADLHSANNKIGPDTIVAGNGRLIPNRLYTVNQHDILTGSQADGTAFPPDKDMTCGNWAKSGEGNAMLGHADRMGLRDDDASKSWNTSHPSRACDAASLVATGGAGLLYCFAAN
jgi:hypothetical protein